MASEAKGPFIERVGDLIVHGSASLDGRSRAMRVVGVHLGPVGVESVVEVEPVDQAHREAIRIPTDLLQAAYSAGAAKLYRAVAREEIERAQQQPARARQEPAKPAGVRVRVTEEAVYAAEEANTVHSTFRDDLEAAAPHMEVTISEHNLWLALSVTVCESVPREDVVKFARDLGLTLIEGDTDD